MLRRFHRPDRTSSSRSSQRCVRIATLRPAASRVRSSCRRRPPRRRRRRRPAPQRRAAADAAIEPRAARSRSAERDRERRSPIATASSTPKACRCRRSPSASARRATSTRARRSRAAYRAFDARVRRHSAPRLLRDQGELQPRYTDLFARLGSGFDIVSGGELARVIAAGGDPAQDRVLRRRQDRRPRWRRRSRPASCCFNVESAAELDAPRRRRRPRGQASRRSASA